MKNKLYSILCAVLLSHSVCARITFGSRDSGFILDGGSLDLGTAELSGGLVRDLVGGSLTSADASCTNMTFELTNSDTAEVRVLQVSGDVNPGTDITLSDNQKLLVAGGLVPETVWVEGSNSAPSIIQGYGEFANALIVTANAKVALCWNGQFNQNITLSADNAAIYDLDVLVSEADTSTAVLLQDFTFAPSNFFSPYGGGDCTINCAGYRLSFGGLGTGVGYANALFIGHTVTIQNPYLQLTGPVALDDNTTLYLHGGQIYGDGNSFTFYGINTCLDAMDSTCSLMNLAFIDVRTGSFGSGYFDTLNCSIQSYAYTNEDYAVNFDVPQSSFTLTGRFGDNDFFAGYASFSVGALAELTLSLNTDVTLYGQWFFEDYGVIKGNGHTITFGLVQQEVDPGVFETVRQGSVGLDHSPLRFEDVTLNQVSADAIDTWVSSNQLQLLNVHWITADDQQLFITGMNGNATQFNIRDESHAAGDILNDNITISESARIELHSDVVLNAQWAFGEDTVIDGRGTASLDVSTGSLAIAAGKTLTVCNMTILGANSASFDLSDGYTGHIELSNVTIVLAETTTWTSTIHVTGPLTVVTGDSYLYGNNMVIDYGTAYYDTVGFSDDENLRVDTGRVLRVGAGSGGSDYNPETTGTIIINGNTSLEKNEYLFPSDDLDGRDIHCTGSGVYNGHGRTLYFPFTEGFSLGSAVVVTVDADQSLVTTNMIIDGIVPSEHCDLDGDLYFGHDTLVRLTRDVTLYEPLRFGFNDGLTSNQQMVLDLQGHTVSLNGQQIQLHGQSTDANSLTIRNGRIIVTASDWLSIAVSNAVVLQDVEIVLIDSDWIHSSGSLSFGGSCRITGTPGSALILTTPEYTQILDSATVTLCDGMVLSLTNQSGFGFASSTSTLEFIGATLRRPDFVYDHDETLVAASMKYLGQGRLVYDHKSYIQPGAGGIYIIDNMHVELRPGALVTVTTNDVAGDQYASAGQLKYGPD